MLPHPTIRTLEEQDFGKLYLAFNEAFKQYYTAMALNRQELLNRLKRINFVPSLSVGAFVGEAMVGFIMSGRRRETAYNAGTALIPAYRNHGLGKKLLAQTLNAYQNETVTKSVLEVVSANEPAIKLYSAFGYERRREVRCFRLATKVPVVASHLPISLQFADSPDWDAYSRFVDCQPTFQNEFASIGNTLAEERVAEAYYKTDLVGAVCFSPAKGSISFIGVDHNFRGGKVATQLLRLAQEASFSRSLAVLNIDVANASLNGFLESRGFQQILVQYEMKKML